MTTKILMPALSPTMTEGNLSKWIVKVGDKVSAGDILAEIETDKATMEIEAVDEGEVIELLFEEGENSIAVNTPIAIIEDQENNIKKDISKNNEIDEGSKKLLKKNLILKMLMIILLIKNRLKKVKKLQKRIRITIILQ